jgi:hypothetical protein
MELEEDLQNLETLEEGRKLTKCWGPVRKKIWRGFG